MYYSRTMLSVCLLGLLINLGSAGLQAHSPDQAQRFRPGQTYVVSQATPEAGKAPVRREPVMRSAPNTTPSVNASEPPPDSDPATPRIGNTPIIMEFSDLQCPDSAKFSAGLKLVIMQRYVATRRAEYQWYDFPLPSHDNAILAATAARCGSPGTEEMRRKIMSSQGDMKVSTFARYASECGVSGARFAECMRDENVREAVLADKALGASYGVRGTPTLVLGVRTSRGQIHAVQMVKAYESPDYVLQQIDGFLSRMTHVSPR